MNENTQAPIDEAAPRPVRKLDTLDLNAVISTINILSHRIEERFPDSSLYHACNHLLNLGNQTKRRVAFIGRPIIWLRLLSLIFVICIVAVLLGTLASVANIPKQVSLVELIQALEAGINELIFFGAGVFFMFTFEARIRRQRALAALHELRCLAHVIDMLQLTKDPEGLAERGLATPSSPRKTLSPFELGRYLDYASEMLALIGKIAALYGQESDDSTTIAAVNEIESLTAGLSGKIWQKIILLHQLEDNQAARAR